MAGPPLKGADSIATGPNKRGSVARWVVRELSGTVMAGLVLCITSWRWDWVMGWALVGVYAATFVAQAIIVLRTKC